jgi:hypothetical protein
MQFFGVFELVELFFDAKTAHVVLITGSFKSVISLPDRGEPATMCPGIEINPPHSAKISDNLVPMRALRTLGTLTAEPPTAMYLSRLGFLSFTASYTAAIVAGPKISMEPLSKPSFLQKF